jgi:hypothetical protein
MFSNINDEKTFTTYYDNDFDDEAGGEDSDEEQT